MTWLEQFRSALTSTTIISSTILPESNQLLIAWRRSIPSGQQSDERFLLGQTWLEAKMYLPIRELVTEQSLTEPPTCHYETIYSDYDVPLSIAEPAAATVTPVLTVPITPWAPSRDKPTREEPLPFYNIPVEQINGPVLLIHGEHDTIWPVDNSYLLADRLSAHSYPSELAVYADRGHNISVSPLDAFTRMVVFLQQTLP